MSLRDWFGRPRVTGPSPGPDGHGELPWPRLQERARATLRDLTEVHDRTWQLGSADWAVDMTQGTIAFTTPRAVATAPMQVIGTLAPDGTWLWGWDHPSVPADLAAHPLELTSSSPGVVLTAGGRCYVAAPWDSGVPAAEVTVAARTVASCPVGRSGSR